MNQGQAKKIRKEVRRNARKLFGEGIEVLGTLIRKRPKYIPKFLWIILFFPIFKRKTYKYLYKYI